MIKTLENDIAIDTDTLTSIEELRFDLAAGSYRVSSLLGMGDPSSAGVTFTLGGGEMAEQLFGQLAVTDTNGFQIHAFFNLYEKYFVYDDIQVKHDFTMLWAGGSFAPQCARSGEVGTVYFRRGSFIEVEVL